MARTFGKAFVRHSLKKDIEKIYIYSRDEMKQWNMHKNFLNHSKKLSYTSEMLEIFQDLIQL